MRRLYGGGAPSGAPLFRNLFCFAGVPEGIYCGQKVATRERGEIGVRGGTLNLVIAILVIILLVILILQFV
jgi:hypothetical protein